ncbi:MAG: transposase [Nitrososphaerales archaeon]
MEHTASINYLRPDDCEALVGRLEVVKDEINWKWYAHIPIEVETPLHRTCLKKASLDLGICNFATLYIEGEKPIIYSGRAVLSDWVYRTKKIAEQITTKEAYIQTNLHILQEETTKAEARGQLDATIDL